MLNAGMVNARRPCSERVDFCIIFAVSGRFLHFKNPFKYDRIFEINYSKSRHAARLSRHIAKYRAISMTYPLTVAQEFSAILLQDRNAPVSPSKPGQRAANEG
jgi:hypothetical protein